MVILHYVMLPASLKLRLKEVEPSVVWRMPSVFSILGTLRVRVGRLKDTNDQNWRRVERLGNDIFSWVENDKKRMEAYAEQCRGEAERGPRGFAY